MKPKILTTTGKVVLFILCGLVFWSVVLLIPYFLGRFA